MFFKRNTNNDDYDAKVKRVTEKYFEVLLDTTESLSNSEDLPSNFKSAVDTITCSIDAIMDFYRYCLCLALDLNSTLDFHEVSPLATSVVNVLKVDKDIISIKSFNNRDYSARFIQACVHSIVFTRNVARLKNG